MTTANKSITTPAPKATKVEDSPEFKAALEAALAAELAKRPTKEAGYRSWATKEIPGAMRQFSAWIAREFPEVRREDGTVDERLVMIASKAYKYFQSSDLCDPSAR